MSADDVCVELRAEGHVAVLGPGALIGRGPRAELSLSRSTISEYHATISVREEGLVMLPLRGCIYVGDDLAPDSGVVLTRGLHLELGAYTQAEGVLVVVGEVRPPQRTQCLAGLGPDLLPISDDANFAVRLSLEPPWYGGARDAPELSRSHGRVWVEDAAGRRALTGEGTAVTFRGGVRFLSLAERVRDAVAPTLHAAPLRIDVGVGPTGDTLALVRDPSRPWRPTERIIGLPAELFLRLVTLSEEGKRDVPLAEAATGLWQTGVEHSSRQALSALRRQLGSFEWLLTTIRSKPVSVRVHLPMGSKLEMATEPLRG